MSMSNELMSIKAELKNILKIASKQITTYILVVYNDPYTEYSIKTKNLTAVAEFVDRISVNPRQVDDCPEMAITALRRGVKLCEQDCFLFFFSDASAKDYSDYPAAVNEIRAKRIMIIFVITGCCESCSSMAQQSYEAISNQTNGRLYRSTKDGAKVVFIYL